MNRCVQKVYSQMISLLFVCCQLVAMQVWWMKACTAMFQWSQTIWFLQNWNIFTCMVDLLGHAGQLQQAENMLMAMPFKPNVTAWMALLSMCRIHGNMEMAEHIAKQILELKPENAAGYVLLLATGISLRMLNGRKRRKVGRNSHVVPGLKWIVRCITL